MREDEAICLSKDRYESLNVALAVAAQYLKENGMSNKVYRCAICFGYHLSHMKTTQYARAKRKIQERKRKANFNYHLKKHIRIKK